MNITRLPILTYHSLDDSGSPISTSPAQFRRQMEHLHEGGWRTLKLDQLLAGRANGGWPARTFALTFDDGFGNFAEHGMPILASCGFTATLSVVSDWVGRTNDWPGQLEWVPRRSLMDWDSLRAIANAGIEIGAHSLSHAHLTRLAAEAMEREIVECQHEVEDRIGRAVRVFAYPYGETSEAIEKIVAGHFLAGFGTRLGFATGASRPAAFERIDVYYLREPWFFRAIETGWLGRYLDIRRWIRELR